MFICSIRLSGVGPRCLPGLPGLRRFFLQLTFLGLTTLSLLRVFGFLPCEQFIKRDVFGNRMIELELCDVTFHRALRNRADDQPDQITSAKHHHRAKHDRGEFVTGGETDNDSADKCKQRETGCDDFGRNG